MYAKGAESGRRAVSAGRWPGRAVSQAQGKMEPLQLAVGQVVMQGDSTQFRGEGQGRHVARGARVRLTGDAVVSGLGFKWCVG